MFYKTLFLFLLISFSCQAAQDVGDIDRTNSNKIEKTRNVAYSCIGSKPGQEFTVNATSTEYIILNQQCIDNESGTNATSTEYIILL